MSDTVTLATTFVPSVGGWSFANQWEDRILAVEVDGRPVGLVLRGRCGGMVFSALDLHRRGLTAAGLHGADLPARSSALGRYILRRQIESLASVNILRFGALTYLPDSTRAGTPTITRRRELGRLLVSMVAGNPVPLGLLAVDRFKGVGLNHQVLAVGAERDERGVRIAVYDPNFPRRDDVELEVDWQGVEPVRQRVAGQERRAWRGLFVEHYTQRDPSAILGADGG